MAVESIELTADQLFAIRQREATSRTDGDAQVIANLYHGLGEDPATPRAVAAAALYRLAEVMERHWVKIGRRSSGCCPMSPYTCDQMADKAAHVAVGHADQGFRCWSGAATPVLAAALAPLVPRIAARAEAGDPVACYRLGTLLLDGFGIPAHRDEAVRWLERAALAGHVGAVSRLFQIASARPGDLEGSRNAYKRASALAWAALPAGPPALVPSLGTDGGPGDAPVLAARPGDLAPDPTLDAALAGLEALRTKLQGRVLVVRLPKGIDQPCADDLVLVTYSPPGGGPVRTPRQEASAAKMVALGCSPVAPDVFKGTPPTAAACYAWNLVIRATGRPSSEAAKWELSRPPSPEDRLAGEALALGWWRRSLRIRPVPGDMEEVHP